LNWLLLLRQQQQVDDATRFLLHHLADEEAQVEEVRVDKMWPNGDGRDGTDLLGLGRSIRPSYDSNTIILKIHQTKQNKTHFE
jgi:hypothetical protein